MIIAGQPVDIGDNLFCLLLVLIVVTGLVIIAVKRRDLTVAPRQDDHEDED